MLRLALSFVLALFLAACGEDDPREALIGDWRAAAPAGQQGEAVMTLAKDGSIQVKITVGGTEKTHSGTWALTEDGKLTLVADAGGQQQILTCDYEIKDGTLRLSGEDRECGASPDFKKV